MKEVLSCGHLNARHCAVSIQLLAAPFKTPDVWRSQLASAPLFICRIHLKSEKEEGPGDISRGSTVLLWGHPSVLHCAAVESHFYAF